MQNVHFMSKFVSSLWKYINIINNKWIKFLSPDFSRNSFLYLMTVLCIFRQLWWCCSQIFFQARNMYLYRIPLTLFLEMKVHWPKPWSFSSISFSPLYHGICFTTKTSSLDMTLPHFLWHIFTNFDKSFFMWSSKILVNHYRG